MTENGRSVLARAARVLLVSSVLSLGASGLWAQGTTGKIQGTVLDPTGQPIANSQVFVLGTSFAALTNEDGFYFINNVPAGSYSMRAQFIGYQAAQIDGVRVLADQTLTVDFRLSGAVALEAITITAATAPIVPRDQVTSKSIVTGEDIDQLPIQDALDVVQLQPGVVTARSGNISIRGSRIGEAVIFIDGAPVRRMDEADETFGGGSGLPTMQLSVPTNTLQEVSVTTGAMEASFGDAQAGVISLVTRSGGPRFVGSLAYETDEPMGRNLSLGYNRFEGAVSGPVFGNLTFSLGGTVQGQRSSVSGKGMDNIRSFTFAGFDTTVTDLRGNDVVQTLIPRFIQYGGKCEPTDLNGNGTIEPDSPEDNYGFECEGRLRPYGWTTNARGSAKLQYTYGSGSRVSVTGLTDQFQTMGAGSYNQWTAGGTRTVSNALILNWVQQVFRGADNELAFDVNLSYQTDRAAQGSIQRQSDLDLRDPLMGIVLSPLDFITSTDRFSPVDPSLHGTTDADGGYLLSRLETSNDWDMLIENIRYDRGTTRPYFGRFELDGVSIPRMNVYGITTGFGNFGDINGSNGGGFQTERRLVGRANIDWQFNRYNRFKFGAEGTIGRLNRFDGTAFNDKFGGNFYTAEPYKWAAYAQDRLDLGDVVLEFGIRYDQFDTRTVFPLVPGRIFTNPAFDAAKTVEEMTCVPSSDVNSDGDIDRNDCDIFAYVWYGAQKHSGIAPRVRVSFPITDRTGFRLSYAHQTQVPAFFSLYEGTNNDLTNTNTNDRFGGDANLGRTILFEFGIRHAFNPDMVLDISAYNKDKVSDVTYRVVPFFDTFSDRTSNVNILTNADFGNVRGVDIQLLRRFGSIFSGQASYTYQNSKSTGSDPTDFLSGISRAPFGVTGERQEAPQTLLRTRDDRRHNLQGTFTVTFPSDFAPNSVMGKILQNVGVFGVLQTRSGLPYTRLENNGRGNTSGGGFGLVSDLVEPLQSSETPWEKYFDLRVTKGFDLGPTSWTAYADIRNVFNFTNKPVLFAETGDVVNDEYLLRSFLEPQLLTMEQDARASGAWTEIRKTDPGGSNERRVGAIDLTSLSSTCPDWTGGGGPAACVLLQRAERRWGNGDGIYDVEEQTAAITARYDDVNAPETFYGQGRLIRFGLQLQF